MWKQPLFTRDPKHHVRWCDQFASSENERYVRTEEEKQYFLQVIKVKKKKQTAILDNKQNKT